MVSMNKQRKLELNESFFNTLFSLEAIHYKYCQDKKYCDSKIVVRNDSLRKYFIGTLYPKYRSRYFYNEANFLSDCIFFAWEMVKKYEIRDGGSWQGMINGSDRKNIGRVISIIKTHVSHMIAKEVSTAKETTKTLIDPKDGKSKVYHVFYDLDMESIDKLLTNSNTEEECCRQIEEASSFWGEKEQTQAMSFVTWFRLNRERILTKSQIELLEKLEEVDYFILKHEIGGADLQKALGNIQTSSISTRLKSIRKRIQKAWQLESKFYRKSFLSQKLQKQLNLLYLGLEIIENAEPCEMNHLFSNWIKGSIDAEIFEQILEELTFDDQKEITFAIQNKADIICEVLYKVAVLIEEKIEHLELSIVKEDTLHKERAEHEMVAVPEHFPIPEQGKNIYLTINTDGIAYKKD